MRAEIKKETNDGYGLHVIDNNRVDHRIGVCYDGEIDGHVQNGYPDDPDKRTEVNNENVSQARQFAKYYVAQETDHETLSWDLDPERIEAARQALESLSVEEVETWFGDLQTQCLSHHLDDPGVDTDGLDRSVALPDDAIDDYRGIIYRQEVYLDDEDEIDAVSGVEIDYYTTDAERDAVRHGEVPDRDPHARIDVLPVAIESLEGFRDYLTYTLRCQIRDCYVGWGLEPPEGHKLLGPGQFRFTGWYYLYDCYPDYFDSEASLPGYVHEYAPDPPVCYEDVHKLINPTIDWSIRKLLYTAIFR